MNETSTSTTNLREAKSEAYVEGILSEKTLEETVDEKTGNRLIKGNLLIQTSDTNFVKFSVWNNSKKSDHKGGFTSEENKTFKGTETVMNEYKSIAEVGKDEATRVRVKNAQIRPNTYWNSDRNMFVEGINFSTNFFTRLKDSEELAPTATFDIEVYIDSITKETVKTGDNAGEETGRVLVKGWLPTYNGIEKIVLVAPITDDEGNEIASAVESSYEKGQTVHFFGNIVASRIEHKKEIPVKIGKPKVEITTEYVNEFQITGSSEIEEEGVFESPFKAEAIEKAITEREINLEKKKSETGNKSISRPNTTGTPSSGRKMPTF